MSEVAINAGRKSLPLEFLDRYCESRRMSFAGSLLLSSLLGAALWPLVAHGALLAWMLSVWLVQAGHALYSHRYMQRRAVGAVEHGRWVRGFLIGALLTGAFWSMPLFLLDMSRFDAASVLMIFAIAGVTAYAGVTMAIVLPVAIAFELAALLPMSAWLFMQEERTHFFMGIATLLYLGMLYLLLRQVSGAAVKAWLVREENRQLSDEQRQSEQRMSRYFENAPGFFFTLIRRPDGRVSMPFASNGIADIYGLRPQDVAESVAPIIALDHPDDVERIMQEMARASETLTPCQVEFRVLNSEKGELWVEARSIPEREEGGAIRFNGFMHDITGRKRMEETLVARERDFRSLAENLPVAVIRYDGECKRRYLNPAAERMLHGSAAELLGNVPGGATVPATPAMIDHYRGKMEAVLATGKACELDFVLDAMPADRQEHYEVRFVPEYGADSRIVGVLAIWYDITERKRMEQALHVSEDKHRTVFESANDAIFLHRIVERDGNTEFILHDLNQKGCELWGYSREDILSGNFDLLAMNNPPYSFEEATRRNLLAAAGEPQLFDWEHKRSDGSKSWGEVNLRRIQIGREAFLLAVTRDITERKRMEQALTMREQEYRTLVENHPDVIIRYDLECNRTYVNPALEALAGCDAGRLNGRKPKEYTPLIDPDVYMRELRRVMDSGVGSTREVEVRRVNGEAGWYMANFVPEFDGNGNVAGLLMVAADITERKQAEAALAEQFDRINELNDHLEDSARNLEEHMVEMEAAQEELKTALAFSESVINAIPDLLFEMDRDGRYLGVWAQNPELLAAQKAFLLNRTMHEVLAPDAAEVGMAALREAEEKGLSLGKTICLDLPQGESWFELSVSRKPGGDSNDTHFLVLSRDITGRKRIENALFDSENMLKEAQRIAHVGSWDVDMVNDVLVWSDEIFRIWEIDKAHFKADFAAFLETVHPEDRERVTQAYNEAIVNRSLYEVEHRLLFPDGRVKHILERGEPQYDVQGKPVRFIGTSLDITDRKLMEEVLAAREREFRSLAGNLPDNIARWDVEGRYLYVNPTHERLLGVAAGEVIGTQLPDTHAHVKAALAQVMATGRAVELVRQTVPVNGELQTHEVSIVPEFDAAGQMVSVLGLGRNMTEFYRMQDAISASERDFRSLSENIPDNIARWSADGRFLFSNPAHQKTIGKSLAEVVGKTELEIFPDGSFSSFYEILAQVVATGEATHILRVPISTPDGGTDIHDVRLVPEFDESGQVVSVLGVGRNMTEFYRMQDTIVAREAEFRALVEQAPEPIIRYAPDGRRVYVNAAVEHISGISASVLLGEPSSDGKIVSADSGAVVTALIKRIVETGEPGEIDVANVGADGRLRHFHNRLAPEFGADGKVRSVFSISHDITERKRSEEMLNFIAQGEWLSGGEEFLYALVRYLGKELGVDHVIVDRLSDDRNHAETVAAYVQGKISPNMRYALQGTPCGAVMSGDICSYPDNVRACFPESGVLADLQAASYVGVPLRNVEGRVIGLIAALDSKPMRDTAAVSSMLQLVAASVTTELVRSQMEDALRESHESLSEAQRISHIGNWELDLASGALLWSDEIFRIFEIDRQQFSASFDAFLNAVHPEDREAVNRAYSESLESRAPYQIEHRLLFPDGRIKHVHERCETHYDEGGKPVRSIGTVQDITVRKQAEESLRASEEKLANLFALSPLGIALTDMQGRYVEFNEAFRAICGYPADELQALDYWTLTPREYEGQEAEQLEALVQTGRYGPYEKEYRQKDGTLIPIQLNGVLVTGRDGREYIWSIVEDITERKRVEALLAERFERISELNAYLEENARNLEENAAELEASQQQLEQTKEWYRSILHSAPDGMMVVDARGVIMQVNARLEAMFGYEGGELLGCAVEVLLPPESRGNHVGMRSGFMAQGEGYRGAMTGRTLFGFRKDGLAFPVDVTLSRLPELDGISGAICASVRDVTERKVMETAREAALAEALRLAKLRSAFMAQMSHELRTPLNGILGYSQNLLQGGMLGEKQVTGLNIIQQSGEHLLTLINGMLDHAAIEADKFELIPGDIQFEAFLSTIIGIIRIRAEQKKIAFSCEAAADLPAVVRGDAQRLRQVLLNLLSNAVKFTDSGRVTLRVGYTAPSRMRFSVQDTGTGIAADQLDAIFLPFEQVGESSRRVGGTGLGLAISRKLVRLMGGDIAVESRPDAGSTFSFEIEMATVQAEAATVNAAALCEQAETRVPQATLTAPPRSELDILYGIALRGNMREVIRHTDRLADLDSRYLPFVEQLRQLAGNFQTKALLSLIEQYRNGQET